jgi:hypothetical protein
MAIDKKNEMMETKRCRLRRLPSPAAKILTEVGHFGDHCPNQRRLLDAAPLAPESVPHFIGIRSVVCRQYESLA